MGLCTNIGSGLDATDIVYVARASTRRIISIDISVGTRFPAHATSMGRVLLAALPEPEFERRLDAINVGGHATVTMAGEFDDRVRGPLQEATAAANAELALSRPISPLMAPN